MLLVVHEVKVNARQGHGLQLWGFWNSGLFVLEFFFEMPVTQVEMPMDFFGSVILDIFEKPWFIGFGSRIKTGI